MSKNPSKILIIAGEISKSAKLDEELGREGFSCTVVDTNNSKLTDVYTQNADLMLIDIADFLDSNWGELNLTRWQERRLQEQLPTIALIPENMINKIETFLGINDFVIEPYNLQELVIRIKRLCSTPSEFTNVKAAKCGDLIIDTDKCEVYLDGKEISLTFKEYELLKFLVANRGKVFTRDNLLNEVWGYDYYGGDRTVDVHIRRLRSKIEDSQHIFIDTVRNIGYKFREDNFSPNSEHGFLEVSQYSQNLCGTVPESE